MKHILLVTISVSCLLLNSCGEKNPLPETEDPNWVNNLDAVIKVKDKCEADQRLMLDNLNCNKAFFIITSGKLQGPSNFNRPAPSNNK